jgi:hypothetical protein
MEQRAPPPTKKRKTAIRKLYLKQVPNHGAESWIATEREADCWQWIRYFETHGCPRV